MINGRITSIIIVITSSLLTLNKYLFRAILVKVNLDRYSKNLIARDNMICDL